MKKFLALALAFIMVFALATTAFAQEVALDPADTDNASITINNASKGETYKIYKLFDATVAGGGPIAYSGTIPESLSAYFVKDSVGNITATDDATDSTTTGVGDDAVTVTEMSEELKAALKSWTESVGVEPVLSAVSDGSALTFTGLPYGYYVVTTTQGESAITVDSTNPNASIVDKNSTTPAGLSKSVNDNDVNIGDTVTYTVSFTTSNYDGAGTDAKQITEYTITDSLPAFLSNVTVTSIIVDNDADDETDDDRTNVTTKQFADKKITLDWYDEETGAFWYENGAKVTITYTATVNDSAAIDGEGNKNEVGLTWKTNGGPDGSVTKESTAVYTYAIALKKVNDKGEALSGATFQFPFYVKANPDTEDGAYIYAGTAAGEGLTNEIITPESGEITIKGVASGEYSITETKAPDGYNKLVEAVKVTAVQTGKEKTDTTVYLDENGDVISTQTDTVVTYTNDKLAATPVVVVNKTGAELPSTGGMGTTVFYVIGAVLMLGAVVVLVSRKRMAA